MIEFAYTVTDPRHGHMYSGIKRFEFSDEPNMEYVLPALNSTMEYIAKLTRGWTTLHVRCGNEAMELPLLIGQDGEWIAIANWPTTHPYRYTHLRISYDR